MKRMWILWISAMLIPMSLHAGVFEDMEFGVRAQGMGGAFTAVANNATAIRFNPAGLSRVDRPELRAQYKDLYGSGIHNGTLDVAYPTRWGTWGVGYQDMGFSQLSERALTISHGLALTRDLAFGYNLTGYQIDQGDRLGNAITYGVDAGFMATIYRRWRLGAFIHNANRPEIESTVKNAHTNDLPQLINVGISYTPLTGVLTAFDLSKEKGQPVRALVGMEFRVYEDPLLNMRCDVRAGVQTEPNRFSTGLGFSFSDIQLDYALTNHEKLPLTHQFGFGYQF